MVDEFVNFKYSTLDLDSEIKKGGSGSMPTT